MGFLKQEEIKGFKILPIRIQTSEILLSKKIVDEKEIIHYIYLKPHQSKSKDAKFEEKENNEKSLFIVNFPNKINSLKSLRELFRQISGGSLVESYEINNYHNDFKDEISLSKLTSEFFDSNQENLGNSQHKFPFNTGLIKFVDKSSLKLFLNNLKKLYKSNNLSSYPILKSETNNKKINSSIKLLEIYRKTILNPEELIQTINESMIRFNQKEIEEEEEIQESGTIIDEDGFQLVVNKHRKTKAAILGKTNRLKLINNKELNDEFSKKKNKKEKQDFYRFQIRERKKQEFNQLIHKFREDQARIRSLKDRKRFRPY